MIVLGIAAAAAAVTWRSTGPVARVALALAVVTAGLATAFPKTGAFLGASIGALACAAVALVLGSVRTT